MRAAKALVAVGVLLVAAGLGAWVHHGAGLTALGAGLIAYGLWIVPVGGDRQ